MTPLTPLSYDPNHCTLCPRRCGGTAPAAGRCRMPDRPVVARRGPPPLGGAPALRHPGAGTVFFFGCSLGCVFCQNDSISQGDFGKEISVARLQEIFWELIQAGAHNIDLVNPTHYAHVVAQALEDPLPVPVVWNSGGYDRVETLPGPGGQNSNLSPRFQIPPTPRGPRPTPERRITRDR